MRIDLHVHSKDSSCSKLTLKQIINQAKFKDLDAICIVNHDIITRNIPNSSILVLVGCEITTKDGHLTTFGINEEIPHLLPVEEAIELLKEQGALIIGVHPFRNIEYVGDTALELGHNDRIFQLNLDAIEIINGRNNKFENFQAKKANEILKLSEVGGSDAHLIEEIGVITMETNIEIRNIDDLIYSIKNRKLKFTS
ncbi:MAG: hypothetical protein EAX96_10270 [Candidatus Lokiarchaeota archaeon]|nr:hypothetical protein [Candidatus Lokiarchaeota archaeon]